jgi:membrane associated rhomboid family serine protease
VNDAAGSPSAQASGSRCYRHPDRPAYVRCQRCGNPVCPECQVPAAVGVHCRDCARQADRQMPVTRSVLGAPITAGAPVVTVTVIAVCVVLFVAQQAPGLAVTNDLLLVPALAWRQPWRMVTAAFLHGSVLHLAFNMYALWVVGSFMEQLLGRARLAALYLGSALGGHCLVLAYFRVFDFTGSGAMTSTLGASGAVFGLFAATLLAGRRIGANISGIATVIGVNLIFSFIVRQVSWQAHVGGLAMGAAMALLYIHAPPRRRRIYAWLVPLGALMLTAAVMVLTVSPLA